MAKFEVGVSTLSTLAHQSKGSSESLTSLITRLITAAAPLETTFRGKGAATFMAFKAESHQIARRLDASLTTLVGVQTGLDETFSAGDEEMAGNARSGQATADCDPSKFRGRTG